jgi:hypothetical protein
MLLICPLPDSSDLSIVNLYLVVHQVSAKRRWDADKETDGNRYGSRQHG